MKIDKAKNIVLEIAAARRKWGKQANPPYSIHQIMDALVAISNELTKEQPKPVEITAEELTKLRRQYAACQNREKARKGGAVNEPETEQGDCPAGYSASDCEASAWRTTCKRHGAGT